MERTIPKNMQSICRLCLNVQNKLINIFNCQDIESLKIQLSVEELCSLKLIDSNCLPKCICLDCKKKLLSTQKFINMCKDSDSKLKKIYQMYSKKEIENNQVNTQDVAVQTQNTEPIEESFINKKRKISNSTVKKSLSEQKETENNVTRLKSIELSSTDSEKLIPEYALEDFIHIEKSNQQQDFVENDSTYNQNPAPDKMQNSLSEQQLNPTENLVSTINLSEIENMKKQSLVVSENKFLCDICSKTLRTNSGLRLHLKMHTGLKPFKCKVCDKGFAIESYKKRHELTHSGTKLFKCYQCSASFASANGFRYHQKTHTGESKYSCKLCNKSFVRNKYLKEHIFTHTGEKPYVCKLCGAGYSSSGSLFVHEKKCTGKTEKRVRMNNTNCEIVSNVYTNLENIKGRVIILKNNAEK